MRQRSRTPDDRLRAVPERVSAFLARCGVASRRHADELIKQGQVSVNGRPASLGQKVTPGADEVTVDGKKVVEPEELVYLALNKPAGYLSTCEDPFGRKTVLDLVKGIKARLFPVGRLDLDAEGLVLLTNDGRLAYLLTHPKHGVVKEYLVEAQGEQDAGKIRQLLSGIIVGGKTVAADYAKFVPETRDCGGAGQRVRMIIGVHEGQKHLVKEMCRAVGYRVLRLTRTRIGPLTLGGLESGEHRNLSRCEVASLYAEAGRDREGDGYVERSRRVSDYGRRKEVQSGQGPAILRDPRRDLRRGDGRRLFREDAGDP